MSRTMQPPVAEQPWQVRWMVLRDKAPEIAEVDTYFLSPATGHELPEYRFLPGQFNMLYLPGIGEVPISVSAHPDARESLAHTVRAAGNVTRALARLPVGEFVGLRGPFGTCWPLEEIEGRDVLLVAGGLGLAPLRPAIYHLLDHRARYGRIMLLYGARTPANMLYPHEYDAWRKAGLEIELTADRSAPGWHGHVGVVPLLVDRCPLAAPAETALLLCGPEVMMRYVIRAARARGFPAEHIWLSLERNMQCAVGLCGHCQLGAEFICRDGPVFSYDRVARLLHVEGL
ncbi:MAG: FAD/NAD(P)-binding protein [Pirellulales bacterium]|nr:FAD/NAD(P)-binding protein [Pirellulales bacterium]